MLQEYLLVNDNIICDGGVHKYFSIKPRVEVRIRYQDGFDSEYNKKKMMESTNYNKLIYPQE
jgi:hypothetical protein